MGSHAKTGRHAKTEMQEMCFYEGQFVLRTGGVFAPKNRRWDEENLEWVDMPGRHECKETDSVCLHVIPQKNGRHYMKWVR